jgi:hypothetical protein
MIVTARPPQRRPKRAQSVTIAPIGKVVQAKHPGKRRHDKPGDLPPDPEADARVAAFFARMIRPRV